MNDTAPARGTVYLIHFDSPYRHARHYLGWTADLDARLEAHRTGRGARLMEVITLAGITWQLARTWPGGRARERAIKNRHEAPRLCPLCTARPKPLTMGRSSAVTVITTPSASVPLAAPVTVSPGERGRHMGETFLSQRAGWPADQLAEAFEYVTGPFREIPQHTDAQNEAFRVFSHLVTTQIASLRAAAGQYAAGGDR